MGSGHHHSSWLISHSDYSHMVRSLRLLTLSRSLTKCEVYHSIFFFRMAFIPIMVETDEVRNSTCSLISCPSSVEWHPSFLKWCLFQPSCLLVSHFSEQEHQHCSISIVLWYNDPVWPPIQLLDANCHLYEWLKAVFGLVARLIAQLITNWSWVLPKEATSCVATW